MEKSIGATTDIYHSSDAGVPHISGKLAVVKHGTELDQEDMARMGKDQVLKVWPSLLNCELLLNNIQRTFGYYSLFAFSMVLMISWETQTA